MPHCQRINRVRGVRRLVLIRMLIRDLILKQIPLVIRRQNLLLALV